MKEMQIKTHGFLTSDCTGQEKKHAQNQISQMANSIKQGESCLSFANLSGDQKGEARRRDKLGNLEDCCCPRSFLDWSQKPRKNLHALTSAGVTLATKKIESI